jgi:hypothetical protein
VCHRALTHTWLPRSAAANRSMEVGAGCSKTEASMRRAEALQRRADRAKEVRNHIVVAAGALAATAEEVALLNQDRETGHEKAVDWICGERLLQPTEAQPSSGKARDK